MYSQPQRWMDVIVVLLVLTAFPSVMELAVRVGWEVVGPHKVLTPGVDLRFLSREERGIYSACNCGAKNGPLKHSQKRALV